MAAVKSVRNAPRRLEHLHRDRGYRWTDSDPIMEFIRNDISDSGWPLSFIAERSGVSVSTLYNWQNGTTKHPCNMTVDAVLEALGWERSLVQLQDAEK